METHIRNAGNKPKVVVLTQRHNKFRTKEVALKGEKKKTKKISTLTIKTKTL